MNSENQKIFTTVWLSIVQGFLVRLRRKYLIDTRIIPIEVPKWILDRSWPLEKFSVRWVKINPLIIIKAPLVSWHPSQKSSTKALYRAETHPTASCGALDKQHTVKRQKSSWKSQNLPLGHFSDDIFKSSRPISLERGEKLAFPSNIILNGAPR